MSMHVTTYQLGLLHHTLELRPDRREPSRNHFVAGHGHPDQADLEALVLMGLMGRSPTPRFCDPCDEVFHVTAAGKSYAIDNLPPAPPPPKEGSYAHYRASECSESFAEWLGIALPQLEYSGSRYGAPRNCVRYVRIKYTAYGIDEVAGEWKPTRKEAKASYKAALKAAKERT
ncbi:hypothetical protein N8I74_10875 [Chitiniphilus purpureus]|uniref:AP2 domain-containing protein n=1 Tax=Chitiniphilus purpureus TaxID=2981137 RepID=A0ABY6DHK9_9NEIS|nr:hypothetical protein [Chitiniphilus sp. CD1]UXY13825.1 hypothetical protein N8I74_10875 [Chitiniphilus sp. CD1]